MNVIFKCLNIELIKMTDQKAQLVLSQSQVKALEEYKGRASK